MILWRLWCALFIFMDQRPYICLNLNVTKIFCRKGMGLRSKVLNTMGDRMIDSLGNWIWTLCLSFESFLARSKFSSNLYDHHCVCVNCFQVQFPRLSVVDFLKQIFKLLISKSSARWKSLSHHFSISYPEQIYKLYWAWKKVYSTFYIYLIVLIIYIHIH